MKHRGCHNIYLEDLTVKLIHHLEINKSLILEFFRIEDSILQQIATKRKQLVDQFSLGNFEDRIIKIVKEIFRNGNGQYAKGKDMKEFKRKLESSRKLEDNIGTYIKQFNDATNKLVDELVILKNKLIKDYDNLNRLILKKLDSNILRYNQER